MVRGSCGEKKRAIITGLAGIGNYFNSIIRYAFGVIEGFELSGFNQSVSPLMRPGPSRFVTLLEGMPSMQIHGCPYYFYLKLWNPAYNDGNLGEAYNLKQES